MSVNNGICRDCQFYMYRRDGHGACRRYAPRPRRISDDAPVAGQIEKWAEWPNVTDDDWCGEFAGRRD